MVKGYAYREEGNAQVGYRFEVAFEESGLLEKSALDECIQKCAVSLA